jgi:ABC-type transporter Mla MlaB component
MTRVPPVLGQSPCPRCRELEREVAQLQRAVASHAVVGQATGILMARRNWTADEAFRALVTLSQHRNRKLREVAAEVVAAPRQVPAASAQAEASDLRRSELTVRLETDAHGEVLTLEGDLDVTTAEQLEQALRATQPGPVRVNLRHLDFADVRGFTPLLRAAHAGRPVRLENTPRFACRLLDLVPLPGSLVVDQATPVRAPRT